MARDGSGNYSLPANTLAVSGDPISSTKFNTLVQDLESDANVDRPIAAGGTGASTAAAARTNLGLAIGTDVQAFDAGLLSIAGLTTQADRSIYTTASDTYAVYTLTAAGRAILDDADASAQRTTLGLGTIATQAANSVSITGGSITGITDLAIADGGTGASDASTARTNLGLAIGTNVQAYSAYLADIAGITPSQGDILYFDGTDWARLAAGSNGTFLKTQGAGANPVWTVLPSGGDMLAANNLSDLTNFATARTNLGLAIGTNVQAFDAGLQSIAGLTTTADRGIYTTASDTYAVYTLTAAGRALLDDADASAQRTTLGLGTAAVKNTGTSGDAVPLLNAANTFSAAQTLSGAGLKWATTSTTSADPGFHMTNSSGRLDRILNTSSGLYIGVDATGTERTLTLSTAGVLAVGGNTVWHAGNDGAGSGLDADTLDGVQGSAYATLAGTQTFTGAKDFTGGLQASGVTVVTLSATQTLTNKTLTSPTINGGTSSARVIASTETTGTLTSASANTTIQATGDITINNSVFAAGDIIVIYAGASSRTITQGSGVTMRLGGSATTGSRTLAARGVAMLFFVSASEVVVSGGAVT